MCLPLETLGTAFVISRLLARSWSRRETDTFCQRRSKCSSNGRRGVSQSLSSTAHHKSVQPARIG
jgi:hypothetical protein